jgi:hypothetical protein
MSARVSMSVPNCARTGNAAARIGLGKVASAATRRARARQLTKCRHWAARERAPNLLFFAQKAIAKGSLAG